MLRDMARHDETEGNELSVTQAASRWGVTRAAVYNWIKEGKVDFFSREGGAYVAPKAKVHAAKRIPRQQLLGPPFKILAPVLGDAERRGLVRPSREDHFSLDDVDTLRDIARGGEPTVPASKALEAAERGQLQPAERPPEPDDLMLLLVRDQGEDGDHSTDEGEDKNGKERAKGDKGKEPVQVHPRQAELDRVIEEARRGRPAPYWYYYTDDEIANGDAVYLPTTPMSAWWKTPRALSAAAPEGRTLRTWYPGRVSVVDKDIICMDLYGPPGQGRRLLTGRMTPKEWAQYAHFEPEEGQYIFYASYRNAADPRDDVIRILMQAECTETPAPGD
jgi:hypothetical protein